MINSKIKPRFEVAEIKKFGFFCGLLGGAAIFLVVLGTVKPQGRVGGAYIEANLGFPLALDRGISIPVIKPGVEDLELSARAVLVKDLPSGLVLFEKNAQESLPIASLTKLMTALVVWQNVGLKEIAAILPEDLQTTLFRANLVVGEKIRVEDLLKAMLVASANDATMALARYTGKTVKNFVEKMNVEAGSLGMHSTFFRNPVGFDEPGHYSTAEDLAKLVDAFLEVPELRDMVREKFLTVTSVDKVQHQLSTTNKLMLTHADVVGIKTGYTTEAKGNLILLVDNEKSGKDRQQYYSIILGSNNREAEMEKIIIWINENFVWTP